MPDYLTQLTTARDGFMQQLVDVSIGPLKPTYMVDGQSMEWTPAIKALQERINNLNVMINAAAPWELHSEGIT